jgi:radical SAM superfamily enzyme YgiQ (UPF0313 family)
MIGRIGNEAAEAVLVVCPMWDVSMPPAGVAYIAASLEAQGIACRIFDLNIELYSAGSSEQKGWWSMVNFHAWIREDVFQSIYYSFAKEIGLWVRRIIDSGAGVVGFSLNGANILFSAAVARRLRNDSPGVCIVFGGASCNFLHADPKMPFRAFVSNVDGSILVDEGLVDYFVLGEGEESLVEIIKARREGRLVQRPGVIAGDQVSGGNISRPELIRDIDCLPFPDWQKLPLSKYLNQAEFPIVFSRGCVNRCSFCNDWTITNGRFRHRSAENIFSEMDFVVKTYGRKVFRCADLLFNGNLKVVEALADRIIASGIRVNWTAQGIIRTDMTVELLRKLCAAGLTGVTYGVESLSDKVLERMGKPCTYADVVLVLQRTKMAGIRTCINLIVGFPGEDEREFQLTKDRLCELDGCLDAVLSLNPCNITGGTALEQFPEKFGIVFPAGKDRCEEWESSDGQNTFTVRKRRAHELVQLLRQLKIATGFVGIYDGEAPLRENLPGNADRSWRRGAVMSAIKRVLLLPVFLFLMAFHFMFAIYIHWVKVVRKSIIFSGG